MDISLNHSSICLFTIKFSLRQSTTGEQPAEKLVSTSQNFGRPTESKSIRYYFPAPVPPEPEQSKMRSSAPRASPLPPISEKGRARDAARELQRELEAAAERAAIEKFEKVIAPSPTSSAPRLSCESRGEKLCVRYSRFSVWCLRSHLTTHL